MAIRLFIDVKTFQRTVASASSALARFLERENLILSLDQGTTNSKAMLFSPSGLIEAESRKSLKQDYPASGWVEQDAEEIWTSVLRSARVALGNSKSSPSCIAITNQRETTILWDKKTLEPVSPAIVWQDRRSSKICEDLRNAGYADLVRQSTGLVIDPYFSATKIMWLLEKHPKIKRRAEAGEIRFGTVDTFLLARLTQGEIYATDVTNASRTMLFDTIKLQWDDELLKLLKIPPQILPEVSPSSHLFGEAAAKYFGRKIPIAALIGDQQASLFGQAIFKPGIAKNTFGTGNFLLSLTGNQRFIDTNGSLLSTIAWGIDSRTEYALEGSVLSSGSSLKWLKDGLGITCSDIEIHEASTALGKNDDVYFVPALAGLGTPYWDPRARGLIIGITGGTSRRHFVRAALEAICYQSRDVLDAFEAITGKNLDVLRVDGGGSSNDLLMQFQADITGKTVQRPRITETTAFGAAMIACITMGFWKNIVDVEKVWRLGKEFKPKINLEGREALYNRWRDALSRSRSWASA